ncbi:MAG: DUF5694 domain-containing protein [Candidatus Eremiobacteraeota bacterium]|nr:DUF5694 domain-containing protein [Candidatus Eremiobacteraeota bacterium]
MENTQEHPHYLPRRKSTAMQNFRVFSIVVSITMFCAPPASAAQKAQVMVVGVAHLEAKNDLHNSTFSDDPRSPRMQAQIQAVIQRLLKFNPTKVMIEARPEKPIYVQRYEQYLDGNYTLGANEDDQFGYRLAALAKNPTIYPIDTNGGFPFDYDAVKASAKLHGQTGLLDDAELFTKPCITKANDLERAGTMLQLLRYLNQQDALACNAAFYSFSDPIGARSDYAGANLVSFWYARNLHIFANIMHNTKPGDRVVVFVGQGHAAILDPMFKLAPYLQFVDPLTYLDQ